MMTVKQMERLWETQAVVKLAGELLAARPEGVIEICVDGAPKSGMRFWRHDCPRRSSPKSREHTRSSVASRLTWRP